ncbi:MAG: 23S rRNA (guanosine(2251)-2'-O)-methyltransferase RlmB [Bowdeniella nasicola]|nr:23S rRNA (guanosine(2251)-2'-O)-methyltransferase RlmB [Bowdeniella nasicola]
MAARSSRPGAVRRPGSKKGAQKGSGGQRRRGLRGRGPTPKAEDRTGHPAKLRKDAQARREAAKPRRKLPPALRIAPGHEIIAGRNAVYEAVRSEIPLVRVFIAPNNKVDDRLTAIMQAATAAGTPLVEITKVQLDTLTDTGSHQGIAIEVPSFTYANWRELLKTGNDTPLFVALDHVTDPHNLGAVLRSAAAFGATGVVIPERRAAGVNATAWKVSAGAAARMPVAQVPNLVQALKDAKAAGCFVVGLAGEADSDIATLPVRDAPLVLVTGAEGKGLSRLVADTCDLLAAIPIGDIESLNAAVATGIALYEVTRGRNMTHS